MIALAEAIQFKDKSGAKAYPISCETGSNVYGNYVKFADGTLICYALKQNIEVEYTEQRGSCYLGRIKNNITFPLAFAKAPAVLHIMVLW